MIERLKSSVEEKFGKKVSCQKDCKILSNCILDSNGEYISPATLRRLFGFLITNSNPSRVTHDILSRYVGYNDWEHYIESNRGSGRKNQQTFEIWNNAIEKSRKISQSTTINIKQKSGINFNKTIHRHFIDERLIAFFQSDFNSTAIIGPGGYGKSTLLANWYEKNASKKIFSKDIIFFIQAISLTSFANSEAYFEDWIMRQLGLSPDYNFLRNLLSNDVTPNGRFVLIIDALDESNLQGSKLERVYASLADFSLKFSKVSWLKIIISTRLYAWSKFRSFIENNEKWYLTDDKAFSMDGANIPMLTSDEIQTILDNTVNKEFSKRALIDELSIELRETLSYPYYLQLFVNVYHPENEYLLSDQLEIFKEFLKKQIYKSQYSEEKVDIINKILELSSYGINPDSVKKNTLKEIYPIHLKHAGNYFSAYEDLISFGIITEEDIENRYGGVSKVVSISNRSLFEFLIARHYIEEKEEVTLDLFKKIGKLYGNHELLAQLIIRLFQFAYKDRTIKPLEKFFTLDDKIIKTILSNPKLAITFRKDEFLRKKLLPIYCNDTNSRQYFFENFPDINNIAGSFANSLNVILQNSYNPDDNYIAHILNTYSGFLSLNEGKIRNSFPKISNIVPDFQINSTISGIWFACNLLNSIFFNGDTGEKVLEEAILYQKQLYSYKHAKLGSFETPLCISLVLLNRFTELERFITIEKDYSKSTRSNNLLLFNLICKLHNGKNIEIKDIIEIDLVLSQPNPLDSHIPKIIGQVLKSTYYLKSNELEHAYNSYKSSIELSNLAGYSIIEVKLLKTLSRALLKLGENTKSIECNNFAFNTINKTGFQYELL